MSRVIATPEAPAAIGHYVQARVAGNMLFTSGCVAIDPKGGPTPASVEEQTKLSLKNLQGILDAAGFKKEEVIKVTVYIADMKDFQEFNTAYAAFFGEHKPCRCCTQAGGLCDPFKVELEAVAIHC